MNFQKARCAILIFLLQYVISTAENHDLKLPRHQKENSGCDFNRISYPALTKFTARCWLNGEKTCRCPKNVTCAIN